MKLTCLCYVLLITLSVGDGAICLSSDNCPANQTLCIQNCTAVALEKNLPASYGNCGILRNETGDDVYYCHANSCFTDFPNSCDSSVTSCCCTEDHCNVRHEDSLTQGTTRTRSEFYLGHVPNYQGLVAIIMTSGVELVNYSIDAPVTGYHHNGNVTEKFESVIQLLTKPISLPIFGAWNYSHYYPFKEGIYISSDSQKLIVIGQNKHGDYYDGDTYFAFPIKDLYLEEYVYYAMSAVNIDVKFNGSVLVIGTENDTMLTVTVPVTAFITNSSNAILLLLRPGLTYSYKVNRLQILYLVTNIYDLTGARIVTNKPVSVLSGHECGFVSETRAYCSNLAEQMLPTELWGTVHYVAPLASRSRYTIKILATHDATIVHIICTNTSHMYTLNTANFVTYILNSQEFCAIHSSNIILVVQFSHGYNEDEEGAPMMTLIPATIHYTNTITSSTYRNPVPSLYGRRHRNYVNIIVMADYYQPSMIFLKTEGVNQSLESQSWVPIIMNNSTEAYATQVKLNITEGMFEIRHINSTALMTAIVYGFDPFQGYLSTAYGHPGWLRSYLVQVRFNQTSYTIDEDEGAVHPVLVLNNQSSYDIAVQINIITGSATGGIDFDSGPYSIKFPAGVTTVLFDILIIDDQTLEQTETFYLSINSVILPDRVTGITPDQTMITIQDNDIVVVSFNQSAYSVDEDDGLALPVLVVNGSSAVNFTVQVMTTDGSATGGDVDYDSGPYSITFPAGVTNMSFDIFINDDEILEENETFFLHIITLPKGVSTGHLNQTMITVLDDDTISPTGSTLDRSTSQVIITTIAAVIAAIMLVLFFGFCAYKLKRKLSEYRKAQTNRKQVREMYHSSMVHISPAHSITYSTIGRDRPSTCESISSKENAAYILPRIDEEFSSVFSDAITNEEMLDFISGHNTVRSCKNSSEFINSSERGTEMATGHSRNSSQTEDHYMLEKDMMLINHDKKGNDSVTVNTGNSGWVLSDSRHMNMSSEGDNDSVLYALMSSDCTGDQFMKHPDYYDRDGGNDTVDNSSVPEI